jgi:hypothetical protein
MSTGPRVLRVPKGAENMGRFSDDCCSATAEVTRKNICSFLQKPAPIVHLRDQGILDPRREGADGGA